MCAHLYVYAQRSMSIDLFKLNNLKLFSFFNDSSIKNKKNTFSVYIITLLQPSTIPTNQNSPTRLFVEVSQSAVIQLLDIKEKLVIRLIRLTRREAVIRGSLDRATAALE